MGKIFGTDGIRGLAVSDERRDEDSIARFIDNREFSCGLIQLVGESLGVWLRPTGEGKPQVVVGWDARPLNLSLASALTVGLHLSGCHVTWIGECATPGLHASILEAGADAGCMITASHNPVTDSGIKVLDGNGYKTFPEIEGHLEELMFQLSAEERGSANEERAYLAKPDSQIDGKAIHMNVIKNRLEPIKKRFLGKASLHDIVPSEGLLLDSSKGVAHAWLATWMSENLVSTTELSSDCQALNKGCGAGELSPTLRMSWEELVNGKHDHVLFTSLANKANNGWTAGLIVGAALDGDGDRCLLIRVDSKNEGIEVVDGDLMLDRLVKAAKKTGSIGEGMIAASIESDLSLLTSLQDLDSALMCAETAVGDRWLAAALKPKNSDDELLQGIEEPFRIGSEDSGHILMTTPCPQVEGKWGLVGDGAITLLATLCAMANSVQENEFAAGWKSRQSISPSDRSKWDGANENAQLILELLNNRHPEVSWKTEKVNGEENLLLVKGEVQGYLCSVAVRNSGTQAKTSISIRTTGINMESLIQELINSLEPKLKLNQ
jgi:phosphoglucosamine mutase